MCQRGDQLGTRSVPAQVTARPTGDGGGDAAGVVRGSEDDDVGLRVGSHQPAGGLHPGGHSTLRPDQDDVDGLAGVAGEEFVPVGDAVDALDPGTADMTRVSPRGRCDDRRR